MRRSPTEAHFAAAVADLVRNHVPGGDECEPTQFVRGLMPHACFEKFEP